MDKKNLPKSIEQARFRLGVRLEYQSFVIVTETLKDGFDALNELVTISASWNKILDFIPDFADSKQEKWIPSFKFDAEHKAFVPDGAELMVSGKANFASLICFDSETTAQQFGEQFIDLWNAVLKNASFKTVQIVGALGDGN
jgi:hypothetical protein